ncbi:MAG: glycosyltransferase family 9 protein [Bryobacteraceae bacterium]|nr:glycosyltransferase family 9 protein [Bryobacteraceae bacterium]
MSILAELPDNARVLIVRLRSLGDCVLTTPAIQILSDSRPDLRIGIVVEARFLDVFTGNPAIGAILNPTLSEVRRFHPNLVINLHGGTRSLMLTAFSGASFRAGFSHLADYRIHNLRIPSAQEILGVTRAVHTAEHLASAAFWLGADLQPVPRARLFAYPASRSRPYAVLHPFASSPEKTWDPSRFLAVARQLQASHLLDPIFIGGASDDLSTFNAFEIVANQPLADLKSLIGGATLFIGNDSGPAHIAAAFGIPVIALFGPSNASIWSPWRTEHTVLQANPMSGIGVEAVLEAASRLLVRQSSLAANATPQAAQ